MSTDFIREVSAMTTVMEPVPVCTCDSCEALTSTYLSAMSCAKPGMHAVQHIIKWHVSVAH